MAKYGLRHKKTQKPIKFFTTSNIDGHFCCDVSYHLSINGSTIWTVDDPLIAEYVRNFSTEWFNASYDTPTNEFDKDELEVIKIIETYEPVEVKIPSVKEYLNLKYNTKGKRFYNKEHYDYVVKEIGPDSKYSLYDLMELKNEGDFI